LRKALADTRTDVLGIANWNAHDGEAVIYLRDAARGGDGVATSGEQLVFGFVLLDANHRQLPIHGGVHGVRLGARGCGCARLEEAVPVIHEGEKVDIGVRKLYLQHG